MRIQLLILPALLLLSGCATPAPQESFSDRMVHEQREREDQVKADQARLVQERTNYVAAHVELKSSVRDAILKGKVVIGMTEEQAWKSLGGGHDFHSIETAAGNANEWTYREMHLIFVNGILTQIIQ